MASGSGVEMTWEKHTYELASRGQAKSASALGPQVSLGKLTVLEPISGPVGIKQRRLVGNLDVLADLMKHRVFPALLHEVNGGFGVHLPVPASKHEERSTSEDCGRGDGTTNRRAAV